ncbi:putative tricarboxylic transport membrane protein [Azospirillum lipoferum]|nr:MULTISPECIES: tripartite tricarboxylate transporter TctB family protein [Azospirillum]MCP1612819.1 putative tricarboxylic transport membrane protein [Azospirillum lipoferum]MDW5532042.1 tripartite tricarboxylate transporter TctB family protein [Azospirillum sp. NL1]
MASSLENPRDVLGGMLMAGIGGAFLWLGGDLDPGSALRMGAGYFPRILGTIMVALGSVIALLAMRQPSAGWVLGQTPWRGVILVLGSLLSFGGAVRGVGLLPVVTVVVFAAAWASRYARLRSALPLSAGLAAVCAFLFIHLLGLPLPLIGPWLTAGYWSAADPAVSTLAVSASAFSTIAR